MSKSLNNAIGINEPPAEMYGKLMSINDELMWKYWVYLTDLKLSEIDALREAVDAGRAHPMEIKKRLARTITAGFHTETAALAADENWARMFQQKGESEDLEEVLLRADDLISVTSQKIFPGVGPISTPVYKVRIERLITACGLASSNADASRKVLEKSVRINSDIFQGLFIQIRVPTRMTVRLGKRAKIAVIV
jgi:tyrosyl-tRNA synthetase